VFLLVGSREPPWGDAKVMFAVAEAIVERGEIDIEHLWPPMSHRGADGRVYSQYAPLPSLVHLPGALVLEAVGPRWQRLLTPLCAQLGPSACAALACALFFVLCRHCRASVRAAIMGAAVLGLCTMLAVYARRPFSEALQVACFVGFLLALLRFDAAATPGRALVLGIAAGLLLDVKLVYALGVAFAFAVLLVRRRADLRAWAFVAAGIALPIALLLHYNHARWGSPWETGYDDTLELADESIFWGVFGLLLSPGKSVLLYNPPLLLAPVAVARLLRERGALLLLVGAATLPVMLFYGRFLNWGGGWCWGPRYWAFAVPALLLPIILWIDRARARAPRIAFGSLALLGALVSVLGNAFYWDHFIRLARRVQPAWLGEPDRSGAVIEERGRGHCDSCIEDTYGLLWMPQFQPIVGHAWLLHHVARGHDWATASADAPWVRHTSLAFELDKTYARAHLDLWPLTWQPEERGAGIGVLAVLGVLLVLGAGAGVRAWRVSAAPLAAPRSRSP
jgi:hypothetical protein